jgi:AcrR family transcriptional regulator
VRPASRLFKSERSFYICPVPRVSTAHLAARRQQILDAARICFLRNGFHQTSMQDVIAAAGLSVGAVYRYFRGKDEIVEAIAEQYATQLWEAMSALVAQDRPLVDAMRAAVGIVHSATGPDGPMRLAVQVWSEALRDERIAATARKVYTRFRTTFVQLASQAVGRGELPDGTEPEAAGAALFSLAVGYGLQAMLTGGPDPDTYLRGVASLLG